MLDFFFSMLDYYMLEYPPIYALAGSAGSIDSDNLFTTTYDTSLVYLLCTLPMANEFLGSIRIYIVIGKRCFMSFGYDYHLLNVNLH